MKLDSELLIGCTSGIVYITCEDTERCEIVFNLRMNKVIQLNPDFDGMSAMDVAETIESYFVGRFDTCGIKRVVHKDYYSSTTQSYSGLWKFGYGILVSFEFENKHELNIFKLKHSDVYNHLMDSCTHYIQHQDE